MDNIITDSRSKGDVPGYWSDSSEDHVTHEGTTWACFRTTDSKAGEVYVSSHLIWDLGSALVGPAHSLSPSIHQLVPVLCPNLQSLLIAPNPTQFFIFKLHGLNDCWR